MKAVRIVNGRVVEIFATAKAGLAGTFHPDLIFSLVDAPDDTQVGKYYSGGQWSDAAPDTPGKIGETKQAVIDFAEMCAGAITGPVPDAEKLGWLKKEAAARAQLAGTADAAQTTLLSIEAGMTGESATALAATIVAKADKYSRAVALISGHRRATIAAIDALGPTPMQSQLDAVLAASKAQAQAALTALLAS